MWDAEGNRYLDLFNGWGCNLLGHCPAAVVEAVREQLGQLIHVPNTWHTELQGRWAEAPFPAKFRRPGVLLQLGHRGQRGGDQTGPPAHAQTALQDYHVRGRVPRPDDGSTSATAQPKYHEGLGPLMAGFVYAPFGDLEAVARLVDDETAAIMIEPIQGEGGVRIPPDGFCAGLRRLADEHKLLLIFDEVQTGCGRTGDWFAYQGLGTPHAPREDGVTRSVTSTEVRPDVLTLSKALCGGLAGGALLTTAEIARSVRPGMHACTFGGNPIAARAGLAFIETVERENLLEHARRLGEVFRQRLEQLRQECGLVREVRVRGVMIGMELSIEGAATVRECLERRLLVNCTHGTVIRLLPAMNLTEEQAHEGCDILAEVLKKQAGNHVPVQ